MKKILILFGHPALKRSTINAHEPWPFSEGKLNRTMVENAIENLKDKGYDIQTTTMQDDYDVEKEIEKHMWADDCATAMAEHARTHPGNTGPVAP